MGFEKGQPRPEKAGRKKGTPNKRTKIAISVFDEHNYDPLIEAIKIVQKPTLTKTEIYEKYEKYCEDLKERDPDEKPIKFSLFEEELNATFLSESEKLDAHLKLAKFIYPQRKAIEFKDQDDKPLPIFNISLEKPKG